MFISECLRPETRTSYRRRTISRMPLTGQAVCTAKPWKCRAIHHATRY